jgi:hypothetical protein
MAPFIRRFTNFGHEPLSSEQVQTDQVNFLKNFWDMVKKHAAQAAGELLGGGGGQNCTAPTTTTVKVVDGKVETMTMTTTKCGPA